MQQPWNQLGENFKMLALPFKQNNTTLYFYGKLNQRAYLLTPSNYVTVQKIKCGFGLRLGTILMPTWEMPCIKSAYLFIRPRIIHPNW